MSRLQSLRVFQLDNRIKDLNISKFTVDDCKMRHVGWDFTLNLIQSTENTNNRVSFGCLNNFDKLTLSFDFLVRSSENLFQLHLDGILRLKELNLDSSSIGKFKKFYFISNISESMNALILSNNKLNQIDSIEFIGVYNLKKLDLSYNNIESIENAAFIGISTLEHLNLTGNKLNLTNKIVRFRGISKLKYLILAENRIRNINNLSFDGIESLEHLDLGSCEIKLLENEKKSILFHGIPKLKQLILANNPIVHIGTLAFYGIESLEYLDLSRCQIKSLQNVNLIGMRSLKSLLLNNNPIQNLENITIKNEENSLEVLDLSSLGLKNMSSLRFNYFENLRSLQLAGNQLNSLLIDLNGFEKLELLNLTNGIDSSLDSFDFVLLNPKNSLKN